MYIVNLVLILLINFQINYLHGAFLNDTYLNYFQNQLIRTVRQTSSNIEECAPPTISNGKINIIKQKSTANRNFLSLNVTCDTEYVLEPPTDYLLSCFNGFWDVDEIPQCKKCIKRSENSELNENVDSYMFCPESSNIFKDCGQRIDKTHQPFVVNGTFSKFGDFPWHIAIYIKDQDNTLPKYHCGGSIITIKHILTVAHCLSDDYGKLLPSREYYAAAGKYHRTYNSDRETTQKRKIVQTDLHPRYRGILTNYAWDIGIAIVNDPFETSTLVHPVCIDWRTRFENEHLSLEKYGEVAGWGKTEKDFNTAALELRILKVPYIDIEQCNNLVPSTFLKYITQDKFCAGYTNGSSVCDGDSGGGLVFEKQEKGQTKYYIRGLVSVGLQKHGRCDEYKYSTYTKVSEHISFIRETIQKKEITTTPSSVSSTTTTTLPEVLESSTEDSVFCKTPNNEYAKCISVYDCKIFVNALKNNATQQVIAFIKDSICGTQDEKKVCCGSTINYYSTIFSDPVTVKPIEHKNLNLLPPPGICGKQIQLRQPKIYGGIQTEIYEYPWMALLEFGSPERSAGFFCSGFLINERYVITAAHCAVRIRSSDLGQVFRVRLGEYDISSEIDCINILRGESECAAPPINIDIEERIIHPLYSNRNKTYDIALLRLKETVSYTDFITPICLPLNGESSLPGKRLYTSGWGQTEIGKSSNVKLKVSLTALSQEECSNAYKKYIKIDDTMVCVIDTNGKDVCRGDTGGPLMSTLTNSTNYYAEGVVSFGRSECGGPFPSVSTRISSSMDWILDTLKP